MKKQDEALADLLVDLKTELFSYAYEKIWEELSGEDRALVSLLLEKKELHGSTGVLMIREGRILFYPAGSEVPSVNRTMIWERKASAVAGGNRKTDAR